MSICSIKESLIYTYSVVYVSKKKLLFFPISFSSLLLQISLKENHITAYSTKLTLTAKSHENFYTILSSE